VNQKLESPSASTGSRERERRRIGALPWTVFGAFGAWFLAHLIPNLALRLRFEDQLIVLRYARNLAEGNGLVYNAGEQVMGFTTPLFTILSSVFVLVGGEDAAAWQNSFGILCMLGTAALAARLLVHLGAGPAAPLAVALITFNPAVAYNYLYVGMEIHLFALLFLLALDFHLRERATAAAVTSALLFLTRPEGALLAVMLLSHGWLRERKPPVRQAVAALATALPWLLFALAYYGSVLPRTLGAKEGESIASAWRYLGLVREAYADAGNSLLAAYSPSLAHSIAGPLLLLGLLFVGATALLRRRSDLWPLVAFPLGALLGYAAIGSLPGYTWHYYTLNVLGAFLLALGVHAGLVGVGRLCRRAVERLPATVGVVIRRPLASALLALIPVLALTLPVLRDTSRQIAYRAEPTERQQGLENMGEWLAERYHPSTSILVREIGHIGWVSGLRIVDRGGLVTTGLRYDVPRRVATEKFLPDLLLLRADNYGVRDPREDAGFPANLGYERVEEFDHGEEWSLHSLIERASSSPREGDEYRYDVARSGTGRLEAVLRYSVVEGESEPPSRIPIVTPPTGGFDGALEAVLPRRGHEVAAGVADLVVSGFIRDEPPDPRGVEAVLLFIGGEMTIHRPGVHRRADLGALYGPAFENGGFAFRASADRELVEREGVLAYAVSRRGVASRLRFSYLPLELEPGNLEILPTTDGRRLIVRPPGDGYDGEFDLRASENRVEIEGWAIDATRGERPRQIVVYRDGHFLTNVGLNQERPDVAERFGNPNLLRAGFRGVVPAESHAASFGERYRVFAVMLRGAAVELSP